MEWTASAFYFCGHEWKFRQLLQIQKTLSLTGLLQNTGVVEYNLVEQSTMVALNLHQISRQGCSSKPYISLLSLKGVSNLMLNSLNSSNISPGRKE